MLDMTGRCVMGWLIVFLLLSIILYNLSKDYRKLAINGRLEILEETSKVTPLYLRRNEAYIKCGISSTSKKLKMAIRLLNTSLVANLVLLSNDVCQNPGPFTSSRMKGMCFFHLNICSLRNKLDDLRLFFDGHKPHVLSLNGTWLDESFLHNQLDISGSV